MALGAMVLALGPQVGSVVEVAESRSEARVRTVSSSPNLGAHPRHVPCPCLTLSASSLLTLKQGRRFALTSTARPVLGFRPV